MKKSLLLCSAIALLISTAVSCTKNVDSPAPNITGYYKGTYHLQGGTQESGFTMTIKDDNTTADFYLSSGLEFPSPFYGNGTLTAKSNTFSGKFYYYDSKPIAVIEGGAIKGTGKDAVLTGTLKVDGKIVLFSVKWVSINPPAVAM